MTNEQAIAELIAEVKIIAQALQEIHNYMTIVDKRVTALEAKQDNAPTKKIDTPTENTNRPTDEGKTCRDCADELMCIMSAPDGRWKACKYFVPKKMDEVEECD